MMPVQSFRLAGKRAAKPRPRYGRAGPQTEAAVERELSPVIDIVLVTNSDFRYLALVRRVVEEVGRRLCVPWEEIHALKVAVGEACANAMKHGSPGGTSDRVTVKFASDGRDLRVEVSDTGPGFHPRKPTRRDPGGYGIRLMRAFADEVQFVECNRGTRVVLVKHLT